MVLILIQRYTHVPLWDGQILLLPSSTQWLQADMQFLRRACNVAAAQQIDVLLDLKTTLQASLLEFIKYFYPLLTGQPFIVPQPIGRESHVITICRELTYIFYHPNCRSMINIEPGSGKSTILSFFMAWAYSIYGDCNFIYISYGLELAEKHNELVKRIIMLPEYRALFGLTIDKDARGKKHFRTSAGGESSAFGSSGPVTGMNAGRIGVPRFSGCVIIDDAHKPDEVHSDTTREAVIRNYRETIEQRPRSFNVPIISIMQRLHELDLAGFLLNGGDGHNWRRTILKAIDECGHVLCPHKNTLEQLLIKQETDIYTFASQYQQDPQPAGGSLFKPEMFTVLEAQDEPEMLVTFITCDTAETSKSYNDASVFSFWGIYKIKQLNQEVDAFGLHWIDCYETRVEPKDLKDEFFAFWHRCQLHKKAPLMAAIEKKSTGVTLLSTLSELRGLQVREIERNGTGNNNKTQRFLNMQPYIAARLISFSQGANHYKMCTEHMRKITANETHAFDDIADTLYDAIKFTFIDKTLVNSLDVNKDDKIKEVLARSHLEQQQQYRTLYNGF